MNVAKAHISALPAYSSKQVDTAINKSWRCVLLLCYMFLDIFLTIVIITFKG